MTSLGMDQDHARLYLHLLRAGPCKASTLASISDFSRSKIYRTLDAMQSAGSVQVQLGQPRIYAATEPRELLDRFEERWARGLERVRRARERLLGPLQGLREDQACGVRPGTPSWRLVQGRLAILDELMDRIGSSATLRMAVTGAHLGSIASPVDRFWEQATERTRSGDLDLQVLVVRDGDDPEALPLPDAETFEVRCLTEPDPGFFALLDEEVVMTSMSVDDGPRVDADDDVAILTDAPPSVARHRILFERLWEAASAPEIQAGTGSGES